MNAVVNIDLPTSRARIFSRARSASGRFFLFSAAKPLLQLFHHLRNFIRYLKKASSDITTKNPLRFGVWISDETLLLSV